MWLSETAATQAAIDYVYDAVGNRQSQTQSGVTQNHTYEPTSNRHIDQAGAVITYDAAGHRKSDKNGARTYTLDDSGRLSQIHQGATLIATYRYNALGQRVAKQTATHTTHYHYNQNGQLIAETHADGTPVRDYIWLEGEPLAQIDISSTGESIHYLHTDHLATPRTASDATGNITWRWDGDAFGNTSPDEDPDANGIKTQINLRFPGQYADVETGFYYNYFRYYDPSVGRYITSDPIGLDGGINTYLYVNANPLRFVDPLGLACIKTSTTRD